MKMQRRAYEAPCKVPLYFFQRGKEILDKILLRICGVSVSEVSRTSQLLSLNFQCTNTRGWAQSLVHQEELVTLTSSPLRSSTADLTLTPDTSPASPPHRVTPSSPETESYCAQQTLGMGFFLVKVQLFLWKAGLKWSVQFQLSQNSRSWFFWTKMTHVGVPPLTQHYPSV